MATEALIYGLRLFNAGSIAEVKPAKVTQVNGGGDTTIVMHLLEGDREQIKQQLLQSIDAFFELQE